MITWHLHDYGNCNGISPRWCGEYWPDTDDTGAPWGVCWVAEYPEPTGAVLWMVLVEDRFRRQGIATALIVAACERWPGIFITEGVTPAGEALYATISE